MKTARRQTHAQYVQLQHNAAAVIMRRLDKQSNTQKKWIDGNPTAHFVEQFIKPNDRLSSLERIEIYNRQYWFRIIDSMYDDFPGLRAVIGDGKFNKLVIEYLDQYPSQSYTMRNLGSHLEEFIKNNPKMVLPRLDLALEMTQFEWAQIIAFDGPADPLIDVDVLLGANPNKLKLGLQPYVTLLELHWPLDDWTIALKKSLSSLRGEASNAVESSSRKTQKAIPLPRKKMTYVAVHRHENMVYYKSLEPASYQILVALRDGKTLARALNHGLQIGMKENPDRDWPAEIQGWFRNWTTMGWFCER